MQLACAILLLGVTIALCIRQPQIGAFRLHHGLIAWIGALVALISPLLPWSQAWQAIQELLPALITIASLMVMAKVAEKSGLVRREAHRLLRVVGDSPKRLFTSIFFLGALTGSIFTNDAAILIWTPLVLGLLADAGGDQWTPKQKIPFLFAVLHIGNLAGPLVISNPINIVVSEIFGISFLHYVAWMLLPALASWGLTFVCLRFFLFRFLPSKIPEVDRETAPTQVDTVLTRTCQVTIVLCLGLMFLGDTLGIPLWPIALGGAIVLLLVWQWRMGSCAIILREGAWPELGFVSGIFLVVLAADNVGLSALFVQSLEGILKETPAIAPTAVAFLSASLSALINNHPAALLMALGIQDLPVEPAVTESLVFASLIGADLGPKMLPIGSLAALLWIRLLRQSGIEIRYKDYIFYGIPTAVVAIFGAAIVFQLQLLAW